MALKKNRYFLISFLNRLLSCPLEEKFRLFMISDHHIVKIILKMYWGYILKGTNTIFAKMQIQNNSPQNEE